jgi:hypothetical protein
MLDPALLVMLDPLLTSMYPDRVTIARMASVLTVGGVGYIGQTRQTETDIFTNLPASVQTKFNAKNRVGDGKVAADAPGPAVWSILMPVTVAKEGDIRDRDIVIDQFMNRYLIDAAGWSITGWKLSTIRLEL